MTDHIFDINKQFVSQEDRLLVKFAHSHPLTPAQRQEKEKHDRIAALRDGAPPTQG